jgi:hypothetical protein
MKKRCILLFLLIAILFLVYFVIRNRNNQIIHYHAGLLVYIDGKLQDFSDNQYMNFEFCSKTPNSDNLNTQIGKAHLHDNVGDVVHIHRHGAVWGDLFKNIKYSFPKNKTVIGYSKGNEIKDIFNYPIIPYDSIIIIIGDKDKVDLNNYVTKQHILDIEKTSESCSS